MARRGGGSDAHGGLGGSEKRSGDLSTPTVTIATSAAADTTWAHTAAATTAVPKVATTCGKTPAVAAGGGSTAANGASAKSVVVVAKARMGRTGGAAAIVAVGAGVGSTHGLAEGTGMGGVPFRWAPPITHYYKIRRLLKTTRVPTRYFCYLPPAC